MIYLQPWQFFHLYALCRKNILHQLIIPTGKIVRGFRTHKSHFDVERRRNLRGKQVEIKHDLRISSQVDFLEEISGKRCGRYRITTSSANRYMREVSTPFLHHRLSFSEWKTRHILFHHHHEKLFHLSCSLFYEIPMPLGKRVGIHDDDAVVTRGMSHQFPQFLLVIR